MESDFDIATRVAAGDRAAFEIILERYGGFVTGLLRRYVPSSEVRDLVQIVFLEGYRSLGTFRGTGTMYGWWRTLVARAAYDWYRHRATEQRADDSESRAENSRALEAFNEDQSQATASELIKLALNGLSPEDRMIISLRYIEDRSLREVSELLGLSSIYVRVRAFRAKRLLRERLEKVLKG